MTVKLFEEWSEEMAEEIPHKDLFETLEELVNAWKAYKEPEAPEEGEEEKDEETLRDEFLQKVEGIVETAKGLVEPKEEEEETEEGGEEEEAPEEEEEVQESEDVEDDEEEDIDQEEEFEGAIFLEGENKNSVSQFLQHIEQKINGSVPRWKLAAMFSGYCSNKGCSQMECIADPKTQSAFIDYVMSREEIEEAKDLSKYEGSITNRLEKIIPHVQDMSETELKEQLLEILNDPTLKASEKTRQKWIEKVKTSRKKDLYHLIRSIYLKGAGLGVGDENYGK